MSGLDRKQKRTEARREYDRFKKMWREDMRLVGLYGKKAPYQRPTFSQWYAQYTKEEAKKLVPLHDQPFTRYEDPWAEQLDDRVTATEPEGERGVATIQIVGDEEA